MLNNGVYELFFLIQKAKYKRPETRPFTVPSKLLAQGPGV